VNTRHITGCAAFFLRAISVLPACTYVHKKTQHRTHLYSPLDRIWQCSTRDSKLLYDIKVAF